jgi:ABC-type nitrate/sulfonate/bicarbonate transport system permease component
VKALREFTPAIALSITLLVIWQIYARSGLIVASSLPAPTDIWNTLASDRSVIWSHSLQTMTETVIGLLIAICLGTACGIIIFLSSRLRKAFYPLLVVSQTVPLIALAPLLLIWFGFDLMPKVIIVVLYCFYPICIAVANGLETADNHLIDLMKSLRATRWQTLRYVQLPAAMPAFFAGLKISTTYAITGAIVGEYVGAYRGLGVYMETAAHADAIDVVFAAITVIVSLSLLMFCAVILIEKWCLPWRRQT